MWLAPVQVKILPISDNQNQYAQKIKEMLEQKDIRVEIDERNEKIGYKIREAQIQKIPYMLVVGEKEIENEAVRSSLKKNRRHGTNKGTRIYNKNCRRSRNKK